MVINELKLHQSVHTTTQYTNFKSTDFENFLFSFTAFSKLVSSKKILF